MKIIGIFWNKEQKRLRLLPRLVLFVAFYELLSALLSILVNQSGYFPFFDSPAALGLIVLGMTILTVFLAGWLLDRRKFADFGFHFDRRWMRNLGFGVLLGALLMAAIFGLEWAFGWIETAGFFGTNTMLSSFPTMAYFWSQFFQSMLFYLCTALSEETFFRGYPIKNLIEGLHNSKITRRQAAWLAACLTSVVFALAHLGNPHSSWISTVNIFVAGIMLALGVVYSGELAVSIGLHFSWNFFQGVIFGFPISGTLSAANLIRIQQSGPESMTGGAFGPEAGLLGLAAMLIGSAAIMFYFSKQNPG